MFSDSKYLFTDLDFDTSATQIRQKLLEIHQFKEKISFSLETEFEKFWLKILEIFSHLGVHRATSIQTFDFSTLYTSIPHDLPKSRMNSIINNAFKYKNGDTRYTHIKFGRNKSYFTSDPLNGDNKYTANDICKMIEFLVDNIYVRFGGQLFRQMVGIPMGKTVTHYWLTCFSIPTKMSF